MERDYSAIVERFEFECCDLGSSAVTRQFLLRKLRVRCVLGSSRSGNASRVRARTACAQKTLAKLIQRCLNRYGRPWPDRAEPHRPPLRRITRWREYQDDPGEYQDDEHLRPRS